MQPGLPWDFKSFSKKNSPLDVFMALRISVFFFSPKTLPLAFGNFTYPTSSNGFFLREFFWDLFGFSSVYLTICAIFLGRNHQIF